MSKSKDKKEKCLVVGKSGAGKDFLLRNLIKKGLIGCLKMTTRPQRKYETQGVTYDFVTDTSFKEKIENDEMLCYQTFNVTPEGKDPETWYYGITKTEFERAQVFIMTPGEFVCIDTETRKNCFVVYLDIDREIREDRISGRNDKNDSVQRRLDADEEDFKGFGDYDLRVTDPDFTAEDVYDLMD
jgi:guanylate kinase